MLEKLEKLSERLTEVGEQMNNPENIKNASALKSLSREYKRLSPIVSTYKQYQQHNQSLLETQQFLSKEKNSELRQMAKEEIESLKQQQLLLEEELKKMLVEDDPHNVCNVILEIRAGTGGEEAALFAADLFRMYARYAEKQGWPVSCIDQTEANAGGYKELILNIKRRRRLWSTTL